jgi:hypothetical protein
MAGVGLALTEVELLSRLATRLFTGVMASVGLAFTEVELLSVLATTCTPSTVGVGLGIGGVEEDGRPGAGVETAAPDLAAPD